MSLSIFILSWCRFDCAAGRLCSCTRFRLRAHVGKSKLLKHAHDLQEKLPERDGFPRLDLRPEDLLDANVESLLKEWRNAYDRAWEELRFQNMGRSRGGGGRGGGNSNLRGEGEGWR